MALVEGMTDAGDAEVTGARLAELVVLDPDQRVALASAISTGGYEPGCWIQCEDSDLLHTAIDVREVLRDASQLDLIESALDGIEEFAGEHAWDPPAPGETGWVVISQSCDLIRDVAVEPFVQLAHLYEVGEGVDLPSLSRKSGRLIPLDPTGGASRHVVDLRSQAFLPKHLLPDHPVRQAVPTDAQFDKRRTRSRFALRVGQRYSRAGIPTDLVLSLVQPLEHEMAKSASMRKLFDATFSELLLWPREDPKRLLFVTPHPSESEDFRQAEDLFLGDFLESLSPSLAAQLDVAGCRVVSLDALLLETWLDGWKLDFDFMTFGSKGDPGSPLPLT